MSRSRHSRGLVFTDVAAESLTKRGKGDCRGFTLLELLTTVTVLAALVALAIPQFVIYKTRAEIGKAISDMRTLETTIKIYHLDNGTFPSSLTGLPNANTLDPWGRPYEYLKIEGNTKAKGNARKDKFLVPLNSDFDLYSMGADGKTVAPITAKASQDDIIRANDGGYFGLASEY